MLQRRHCHAAAKHSQFPRSSPRGLSGAPREDITSQQKRKAWIVREVVRSAPFSQGPFDLDHLVGANRGESVDAARRQLSETFAEVAERAHRAGVEVEHAIIEADKPAEALLAYAHDHGFDLIICGHHLGRAGRLLLRDVADDLNRNARTPVLVVGEHAR